MNITNISINLNSKRDEEAFKATASITLNSQIRINHIRIIEQSGKLHTFFPSIRLENGKRLLHCYPINKTVYTAVSEKILEAYEMTLQDPSKHDFDFPVDADQSVLEITDMTVTPINDKTHKDKVVAWVHFEVGHEFKFFSVALKLNQMDIFSLRMPKQWLKGNSYRPSYEFVAGSELEKKVFQAAIAKFDEERRS